MEKRARREQMNVNLSSLPPAAVCTLPRREMGGCTICGGQTVWKNVEGENWRQILFSINSLTVKKVKVSHWVADGRWDHRVFKGLLLRKPQSRTTQDCISSTYLLPKIFCSHTACTVWLLMGITFIGRLDFLSDRRNTQKGPKTTPLWMLIHKCRTPL